MDVVENIRTRVLTWTKGGEAECRQIVNSPHVNLTNPGCVDVLTTAYHTLLSSTLLTFSPKPSLSPAAFVDFVRSVLNNLPSSSQSPPQSSQNATIFGEHLVDMIWSLDAELDEIIADAKAISNWSNEQDKSKSASEALGKAQKAKTNAENDKETIQAIVRRLLDYRIIDPALCRERLDSAILAGVGLIVDKVSLDKKEIRTRTGLFYKQNKFNLLREQSEGYSKLIVELTSNLGPAHSPATAMPVEPLPSIEERVRPVWERVISLIGYFDLDPNRALDIILDVLSTHLATHYTFFLTLLSFSPWRGSYNRSSFSEDEYPSPLPGSFNGKSLDDILTLADHRSATTSNKTSRVLAQVLGFKFSYYASSNINEPTPKILYLTAALLIREGFVSLEDLYPHMSPSDEDMDAVHKEYLANIDSRIAGAKISQLALAAPLESSSQPSQSKAAPAEPKKSELRDHNQKIGLLSALLTLGALKPSIVILSKFPWLVDSNPEIADLILRLLRHSISPLYESSLLTKERNPSFTLPRPRYGSSGLTAVPPRKPVLTLWAPTPPSTSFNDFVFFFPHWVGQVPICSTVDDLVDVIEPLLRFVGLHVSRDPVFLTKFLRLGRLQLGSTVPVDPLTKKPVSEPDPCHPIRQFWFKVLRVYLLPALPLIRGNAVCTVEVWNIVRQFETTGRWRLYGEWKSNAYKSHPELRVREVQADRESKGILRRLSHNTIDSLSGPVAKLAHSNPCIFFANAVNQIMAYDNLASVVIQALRYVTNMGFDVLVYIILDALTNPRKERVKDDGVNTSDWLQSLASFTGMLFRRYSADLTPFLKYIVHQLHNAQTTEIAVLRELIWKMAGIEPLPSLSESQIAAMAGGPVLRIEAVASATRGARLDPGDAGMKGPQRLGKALLDSNLALPLLIQVAQQRQACVFKAPDTHLKSLASLYDTTHGVLLQYLELLTSPSVIPLEDYAKKVLPPIGELREMYGIGAPICMQIVRSVLQASLLKAALAMKEQERAASEEAEKRLKAALLTKREPTIASRVASPSIGASAHSETQPEPNGKQTGEEQSPEEATMDVDHVSQTSVSNSPESPWIPELATLFGDVKKIAPGNAFEVIGPGFYMTFWQLSTYDLTPPAIRYDEEGAALRTLSRQEDSKYIAADRSADRVKRMAAPAHRTRRDRYNHYVNLLAQEFKEQTISREYTIKRLGREKHHWFTHSSKANLLVNSIIEHCIQPRSLLSPMDADFCAQFIKVMHTQGTPGFHTLMCYDKLLGDHVKVVLFSCSEYEARNYGRFLLGILTDLHKWNLDEQLYSQDNRTKVGGKTIHHPGFQRVWSYNNPVPVDNVLKWVAFQQILRKWHRKLGKCFIECIQTGEFMHVYNAIIVLKEVLPVFPLASVTDTGGAIDAAMDKLLETEERGDLKILGRAYSASLKKRESLWALPKIPKPNGTVSPKLLPNNTEKARNAVTNVQTPAQSTANGDVRRPLAQPTPSAPRAQLVNNASAQLPADKPLITSPSPSINSTKLAMESIPRPEVVKRIRPDAKSASPKPSEPAASQSQQEPHSSSLDALLSQPLNDGNIRPLPAFRSSEFNDLRSLNQKGQTDAQANLTPSPQPYTPEEKRTEGVPNMPPPTAPSQTLSAQELRETAKQSMNRSDRLEPRSQNGSAAPSPRRRSPSPITRPGTRDQSTDSRGSGGRGRVERTIAENASDDKRQERDSRADSRAYGATVSRRDSLTHNRSDRGARERARDSEKDREGDRERDRGRDRHSERDRDRDRDRERDRGRERERERERDRDRHRRDDKDRDRDRKDREDSARSQSSTVPLPQDDRSLPTRPDPSRHRGPANADDGLGKRRRPIDDEPDRSSKRSSRKESHRDDRSRRPAEKDPHDRNRESDRRRKERDGSDNDGRAALPEKPTDKRIPEGPSPKSLPVNAPSAPRAMSSGDTSRKQAEPLPGREWARDQPPQSAPSINSPSSAPSPVDIPPQRPGGSLRSRIGDKETVPAPPSSSYRGDNSRKDDERDNRKRSTSDRDKESDIALTGNEQAMQPPKRPKLGGRSRYSSSHNPHALARKLLPIDPSAADKSRGRKD
ncbi:Transcription factor/nuclear export subunit protein 2 domain containing protein [Amanita muscaria]